MTRLKKVATFLLCGAFVFIMSVALFACSSDGKEEKYDVAIRVECSDGDTYEFSFGEHEKHVKIADDGISRTFEVPQYRLKGYKYDGWLDRLHQTDAKFELDCFQIIDGYIYEDIESINGPGEYCVQILTDSAIMSLTDYTKWLLYITIE